MGNGRCFFHNVCSSKDSLVKLWDMDTQHCFHTVVSHHREVWSLQLVGGGVSLEGVVSLPRLVTASGDSKMRLFRLSQDLVDMNSDDKVVKGGQWAVWVGKVQLIARFLSQRKRNWAEMFSVRCGKDRRGSGWDEQSL